SQTKRAMTTSSTARVLEERMAATTSCPAAEGVRGEIGTSCPGGVETAATTSCLAAEVAAMVAPTSCSVAATGVATNPAAATETATNPAAAGVATAVGALRPRRLPHTRAGNHHNESGRRLARVGAGPAVH